MDPEKGITELADRLVTEFDAATSCPISHTARETVELLIFTEPETRTVAIVGRRNRSTLSAMSPFEPQ